MADGKSRSHGKDKRASTSKRAPQPAARVRLPLLSREAALVADSEYFDAQWYAARYLRSSDVEPAEHYVSVGWREGHDPGPNFDTGWYLMVNGDVDAADLNPLVHFLEYGEREGRLPNPGRSSSGGHRSSGSDREDVGLVRDHPLFDAAWYAAQHPGALKPGEDPAEHYVRIGGHQGLDPSPRFRSRWYLETNDDVLHSGLNPLVHYIRYGRDEGRLPVPEQITAPNILAPEAALAVDPEDTISLEELAPVASRSLVTVGGTNIGLVTDGDPRAAKPLGALVGFAALHGWQTRYAIELQPASGVGRRHALPAFDLDNWRSLEEFTVSGAMISDLWFMAESQLRLRVEARDGPTFSRSTRLRCYQSDGVSLHLCREAEVSGDSPTFLDIDLINPFLPILVAATDTEDLLTDAMVVPFPSLLRGGLHHAEVAARGERATRTQDVRQISDALVRELLGWGDDRTPLALVRVDVDVQDATGAERIFSRPVIEWLARVMQIGLAPTNLNSIRLKSARMHLAEALAPPADLPPEAVQAISERRVKGTSLLTIPADSVPTIAALVSRRLTPHDTDTIPAPFLVADPITFRPSL
ncbi:MAG: hypothetical protein INF91_04760 [Alphaproteobacteria bacterium]|nr:hypothetical protein [Alphaproteobacteria bacterium]